MPEPVVCNTTPLYYLFQVGILEILRDLYGTIFIPEAVVFEIDQARRSGYRVPEFRLARQLAQLHRFRITGTAGVLTHPVAGGGTRIAWTDQEGPS